MKKIHSIPLFALLAACIVFIILGINGSYDIWGIATLFMMILTMGIMFFQFERGKITSKEISLVAILSGFSAVSRLPFAAIPSVQPCTYIIICTGYVFGPTAGFMVGATTALVSNIFLGQGPWTVFQMFAWGLVGITASFLQKLNVKKLGLIGFGVIWGYLFGWITNLWAWLLYIYPHNIYTLAFTMLNSVWFDTLHALGNALFLLILGEKTIKILQRYKNRFHVEYSYKKPSTVKTHATEPLSL
ncbi:MAG: ECF transporter S component [Thermoplasmatales archaeon]|nr:ECF transporter S component [Thermoplasmatales archaeon]